MESRLGIQCVTVSLRRFWVSSATQLVGTWQVGADTSRQTPVKGRERMGCSKEELALGPQPPALSF